MSMLNSDQSLLLALNQDLFGLILSFLDGSDLIKKLIACGNRLLNDRVKHICLDLSFSIPNQQDLLESNPASILGFSRLHTLSIVSHFKDYTCVNINQILLDHQVLLNLPKTIQKLRFEFPDAQSCWIQPRDPSLIPNGLYSNQFYQPILLDVLFPKLTSLILIGGNWEKFVLPQNQKTEIFWTLPMKYLFVKRIPSSVTELKMSHIHTIEPMVVFNCLPKHLKTFESESSLIHFLKPYICPEELSQYKDLDKYLPNQISQSLTSLKASVVPLKKIAFPTGISPVLPNNLTSLIINSRGNMARYFLICFGLRHLKILRFNGSTHSISFPDWRTMSPSHLLPQSLEELEITVDDLPDHIDEYLPKSLTNLRLQVNNAQPKRFPESWPAKLSTLSLVQNRHMVEIGPWKDIPATLTDLYLDVRMPVDYTCLPPLLTRLTLKRPAQFANQDIKHLPRGLRELHLLSDECIDANCLPDLPPCLSTFRLPSNSKFSDLDVSRFPPSITDFRAKVIHFNGELLDSDIKLLDWKAVNTSLKKHWNPMLLRNLSFERGPGTLPHLSIQYITHLPIHITQVDLRVIHDTTIILNLPNLVKYNLLTIYNFALDKNIKPQKLKYLEFETGYYGSHFTPNLQYLPNCLETLKVPGLYFFPQFEVHLPTSLKHITLDMISIELISGMENLEELILKSHASAFAEQETLRRLPTSLKVLELSSVMCYQSPDISNISLPNLTRLKIEIAEVDETKFELLPKSLTQVYFKSVKIIQLPRWLSHFDKETLVESEVGKIFLKECYPNLEFLDIEKCEWKLPFNIDCSKELHPNITTIMLSYSYDDETSKFLKHLPCNLTKLELGPKIPVDHTVPKMLPAGLTHLKCNGAGFDIAAIQKLPRNLTSLHLYSAKKWYPRQSMALPPNLTHLYIACHRLIDESLAHMPKSLTTLHLPKCTNLSPVCLKFVPPNVVHFIYGFRIMNRQSSVPLVRDSIEEFEQPLSSQSNMIWKDNAFLYKFKSDDPEVTKTLSEDYDPRKAREQASEVQM